MIIVRMSNSYLPPQKKNLKEKMYNMIFRVGYENVICVPRLQMYTGKHTWPELYACLKRQDPKFLRFLAGQESIG